MLFLHNESPEPRLVPSLADALLLADCPVEAGRLLLPRLAAQPALFARYLLGIAVLAQGRGREGIARLYAAEQTAGTDAEPSAFFVRLGYAYFKARRIGDARRAFERVLQRDGESATGYLGLAGCALLRRDLAEAVRCTAKTVAIRLRSPFALLILARAYSW